MTEVQAQQTESEESISDEQAIMQIANAMKQNAPSQLEKDNIHTFLKAVVSEEDTTKVGYLKSDKDLDELGVPEYSVRGAKEMALISNKIMGNSYFKEYFEAEAENTLSTSLSRDGFLIRQATTQTKAVADVTKRRKINKGWFGKKNVEEQGGDPYNK